MRELFLILKTMLMIHDFDINSWTNIHGIAAYKDQTAIKKN